MKSIINFFGQFRRHLIAHGTVSTGVNSRPYYILFFETKNSTRRKFKIRWPSDLDYIKRDFYESHFMHELDIWVNGGCMPDWAVNILVEKLSK